jgi:hypothetical protein
MYDPAIATVHPELVSVDRGSHINVGGHFSHMNLKQELMHVKHRKHTDVRENTDQESQTQV